MREQAILKLYTISTHLDCTVISQERSYDSDISYASPKQALARGWKLMTPPIKAELKDGIFFEWWFKRII